MEVIQYHWGPYTADQMFLSKYVTWRGEDTDEAGMVTLIVWEKTVAKMKLKAWKYIQITERPELPTADAWNLLHNQEPIPVHGSN